MRTCAPPAPAPLPTPARLGLRMEGASLDHAELRLLLWLGGTDHLLARTHWHAAWIHWLGAGVR